jgi:hypothetical protein
VFSPAICTPEYDVHALASAPPSPVRIGSSSPPIYCQWIDPERFGGSFDGEGSSSKGAWYTRAVNGDSQCSLPASVVLVCVFDFLIYVLLLTLVACYGRS